MRAIKVIRDPKAMDLMNDGTRRKIIDLLRAKEMAVIQIAEQLEKTPQAIYHHIGKMLDTGLIEVAKEERIGHFIETYYRATAEFFMSPQPRTRQPSRQANHRQTRVADKKSQPSIERKTGT